MKKWKLKIHKDVIQGTEEWFNLRSAHLSASTASVYSPKGLGRGLRTLIDKKIKESIHGESFDSFGGNYATAHGHKYEDAARQKLAEELGIQIDEIGFIEVSEHVGVSPDGVIGKDGGVEIKCFQKTNHLKVVDGLDAGKELKDVDKKIYAQIQYSLMVSERTYWYFIAYHPDDELIPSDKCFRYCKIERDEPYISYMRAKVEIAEQLIEEGIAEHKAKEEEATEEVFDLF